MTIATDIVATLGAVFAGRLFPSVAPAGTVAPYAVFQMISGVPSTYTTGQGNLTNARMQVDIFARDKMIVDALATQAKSAMNVAALFKSVCVNSMDIYEEPAQFFRVMLDFSIWRSE